MQLGAEIVHRSFVCVPKVAHKRPPPICRPFRRFFCTLTAPQKNGLQGHKIMMFCAICTPQKAGFMVDIVVVVGGCSVFFNSFFHSVWAACRPLGLVTPRPPLRGCRAARLSWAVCTTPTLCCTPPRCSLSAKVAPLPCPPRPLLRGLPIRCLRISVYLALPVRLPLTTMSKADKAVRGGTLRSFCNGNPCFCNKNSRFCNKNPYFCNKNYRFSLFPFKSVDFSGGYW